MSKSTKKKPARKKAARRAAKSVPAPPPPVRTGWRSRIVDHGEVEAAELLENPLNWRKHPQAQQDALAGVLEEVGWVQDVIVNRRSGRLVDGHLRVALAKAKGEKVPVVYVDLDDAEESTILASIDPLAAMAETDTGKFEELVAELHSGNAALESLLHVQVQVLAPVEGEDDAPEPPAFPVTVLGDLWLLGEHRVLCGDSTSSKAVSGLLGGRNVDICLTDPPYGIGDTVSEKNDYDEYEDSRQNLAATIAAFLPISQSVAPLVVLTPGNGNAHMYPSPTWTMAWFTPAGVGRGPWGFCCWQPILCYGKDPKLANGEGCHPDAVVHTEAAEKLGHPCSKPVGFWSWLLERTTKHGNTIFEPFGGSGTGFIAAEKLGRACFGIEISPRYVDVIVRRWQTFTGKSATLDGDGRTFDEIAGERRKAAA